MHTDLTLTTVVTPCDCPMRLDVFLAKKWPHHSRTRWKQYIKKGAIHMDGQVVTDPNYNISPLQQCCAYNCPVDEMPQITPCPMDLDIVYEDDQILIVNKPAGLTVHPGAGTGDQATLVHGLIHHCGANLSSVSGSIKPGIVHRLDKDTTGLMAIAKTDSAHRHLCNQFEQRTVDKRYWAFIWGRPTPPVGRLEDYLGRCPIHRHKQAVVPIKGRYACMDYRVLTSNQRMSWVECRLHTGRTHQIRVQWAHCHHPLIGDPVYGRSYAPTMVGCTRQALHAHSLGLAHPTTGQWMTWSAPLPRDLEDLSAGLPSCRKS